MDETEDFPVPSIEDWLKFELQGVESLRKEILIDLIGVCKAMRAVQHKLSDDDLSLLLLNEWDQKDARRHLAEASGCLVRAMSTMEKGVGAQLLEEVRHDEREAAKRDRDRMAGETRPDV